MEAVTTIKQAATLARESQITFLAASVAYYAFVSLIPLVLLAMVVGSVIGGEALAARLAERAGEFLPDVGSEIVTTALTAESGRAQATVVGAVVAVWGAIKVFRGLTLAFDDVYGAEDEASIVRQVIDAITVLVAIMGGIALMIVVSFVVSLAPEELRYLGVLSWLTLVLGLVVVFLPMYYFLPPVELTVREALPGASVAAGGWTLLQIGFQIYAANAGQYEAYGLVGAILLFVTWLYFAGILILFGAVVNVVVSRSQDVA